MTFDELQLSIKVTFNNKNLLRQAFIHRSFLNEDKTAKESNERLEFLGDAILSFCTSQFLYTTYPNYPEGTLTNIRSSLVKTTSLSDAAKSLRLGDLLLLSHGEEDSGGRNNQSLLADCFEALLGAMYLDQGIDVVRMFLETHLFLYAQTIIDQKSYIIKVSFRKLYKKNRGFLQPTVSRKAMDRITPKYFGLMRLSVKKYLEAERGNPSKKQNNMQPQTRLRRWGDCDRISQELKSIVKSTQYIADFFLSTFDFELLTLDLLYMVKIRLTQTGTKNRKQYRIIAIEEGKRRDGSAIEILGFYNPLVVPPQIKIDHERVKYWVSVGAQITPSVQRLLSPS